MAKYIDCDAFIAEKRKHFCENCDRRKGIKRGKMQFCYEIGGAPCRACDVADMLDYIEDFPSADVRPLVRGRWLTDKHGFDRSVCSVCEATFEGGPFNFCPKCGADLSGAGSDKRNWESK